MTMQQQIVIIIFIHGAASLSLAAALPSRCSTLVSCDLRPTGGSRIRSDSDSQWPSFASQLLTK